MSIGIQSDKITFYLGIFKITHRAAERNLSWCEWAEHRLNFCRNVAQSANFLRVPSTGVARRADDEAAIVLHGVDQN